MRIRLETRFRPFARCLAYGTTAGSQWWVIKTTDRPTSSVTILVQPGTDMLVVLDQDRYMFSGRYSGAGYSEIWGPAYILWAVIGEEPRGVYADLLRNAVCFEFATNVDAYSNNVPGDEYLVARHLIPKDSGIGRPHRWVIKRVLTGEEVRICSVYAAELVCEHMLNTAMARRREIEDQIREQL